MPAPADEVRYSDLGSPVPRGLQTAPYFVFEGRDVAIDVVLPRLAKVPRTWLPPAPIRVSTFAAASSLPEAGGPPSFREGPAPGLGKFAFDRFGGHWVDSSYGVFKCLLLDPATSRDERALEIFRFAAANIVHSCVDKATILPWATRTSYVRPDLLLAKLFLSDQPLALHCDHASQVTAYLLHLAGYRVREILMTDPVVNSGHVVAEVFLPEQRRWVMLDPDFGVLVTDSAGRPLATAELMTCTDRKRDLVVECVVEKRWQSGSFDVGEAFSGQLAWSLASSSGSSTVHGDSYYQVMERCFRARTEITYRFNDGFEDNRLEKAGDIRFDTKAAATVIAAPAEPFESGEGKDAVMYGQAVFDPLKQFKSYFTLAGSVTLDACPVCESRRIAQLWRLPQSRLAGKTYLSAPGEPHNNTYLDYLPLLKVPQEIFGFDMCADCHSIFRNPKDDDQEAYKNDTSKVASFKQNGLDPFRGTAAVCEALFPANTRFVVDAACGSGQVLAIYREKYPDLRLFGLELSAPSVEWIKGLGIDAAVVDLDLDDLDRHIAPGTVDFIVFNEAFEHVRSPLQVLRKMFRMLRPGGRIHVTAQYFGPENALQIRVGEPIYIDRYGLDWVIDQLDAELIELKADIKYRVTLEKKP
jgi:SAM-dependent methyltransferase